MKRDIEITIYGAIRNNATIRFPTRKNPAIAVQSDTFKGLIDQVQGVLDLLTTGRYQDGRDELEGILEFLAEIYAEHVQDMELEGDRLV